VLFFEADRDDECEVSYADKKGKYQGPAYPTQHRRCSGVACSLLPAPCSPLIAHWTVNRIVSITFPAESRTSTRQAPVHSGIMALLLQVRHGDPPMRSSISAIS